MASKEPEYPKPLWLPGGNAVPVYANKEAEEESLRTAGYTDRCPFFEFPKHLYHATLKDEIAQNAGEQKEFVAKGYQEKPIEKPADAEAAPTPEQLQAKLDAQHEIIKQLLAQRDFESQAKAARKKE